MSSIPNLLLELYISCNIGYSHLFSPDVHDFLVLAFNVFLVKGLNTIFKSLSNFGSLELKQHQVLFTDSYRFNSTFFKHHVNIPLTLSSPKVEPNDAAAALEKATVFPFALLLLWATFLGVRDQFDQTFSSVNITKPTAPLIPHFSSPNYCAIIVAIAIEEGGGIIIGDRVNN